MNMRVPALALACAFVFTGGALRAQSLPSPPAVGADDPTATARFHFGALHLTPTLLINNAGVDTNVFNSATDPKQDTTIGVGPSANMWLRMRRLRVAGVVGGQYLYYKTYASQRSWASVDSVRVDLPMARVQPFVAGAYNRTRDRASFEIDARTWMSQTTWSAGTALRLTPRSSLLLDAGQQYFRFDSAQSYRGIDLAGSLNRRSDVQRLQFTQALTPLTSWLASVETIQDRFDETRTRNADSVRVLTGFDLRPAALISGKVLVGFRHFNMLRDGFPDYNGLVASASASMAVGRNRVTVLEQRDIAYSYSESLPYAVQTTTTAEVRRRLGRTWDAVGRGTLNFMRYRGGNAEAPVDRIRGVGAGLGYVVGRTMRIGINVDYSTRAVETTVASGFTGIRAGLALSYGLAQ